MEKCKYKLPCGKCDKYDKVCDAPKDSTQKECKHDWVLENIEIDSLDVTHYYICSKCGKKSSMSLGI